MIAKKTRTEIKGYLEGFIQGMVDEAKTNNFDPKKLRPLRNSSKEGELKPFHESLLPDGILRITEFERSFSTKLGTTFEECARLIAESVHKKAERGYKVVFKIADLLKNTFAPFSWYSPVSFAILRVLAKALFETWKGGSTIKIRPFFFSME